MGKQRKHPLLRIFGIGLASLIVLLAILVVYIRTHKAQFISTLESWYNEHNDHDIHINNARLSVINHFPHIHLSTEGIAIQMVDTHINKQTDITIDHLSTHVKLGNFLKKELQFEHIEIIGATFSSTIHTGKNLAFYESLPYKTTKGIHSPILDLLNDSHSVLLVHDSRILISDSVKNKRYDIPINEVRILASIDKDHIMGQLYVDATLDALGFNLSKGTFGNGADVNIDTEFQLDTKLGRLHLTEHLMKIENQRFLTDINLYFEDTIKYQFEFDNLNTDFSASRNLLSQSLQEKLRSLSLSSPFSTTIEIEGKFAFQNNPLLHIKFELDKNQLSYNQDVVISDLSLSGELTNRKLNYTQGEKAQLRDLTIQIPNLQARYESLPLNIHNLDYQTSNKSIGQLQLEMTIDGEPQDITNSLVNVNYELSGGKVQMNTTVEGDFNDLKEILASLKTKLKLQNTELKHKISGFSIPLDRLNVDIHDNVGQIEELTFRLAHDEINFTGTVTQISDFLKPSNQKNITSNLRLWSEELHIKNLLDQLQDAGSRKKSTKQAQKHINEIIADIEAHFSPNIQVSIDKLYYSNWLIHSFHSGLYFDNTKMVVLDSTSFYYGDIRTSIVGYIQPPTPDHKTGKSPTSVDFQLVSSGHLNNFNQFFGSSNFKFLDGKFHFDARLDGLASSLDELKGLASGHLNIRNSEIQLNSLDKVFDIPQLDLTIDHDHAYLNVLALALESGDSIHLKGSLDQFKHLITSSDEQMNANLDLRSTHLQFDELINLFKPSQKTSINKESRPIMETIEMLKNSFNPTISVQLDSLYYAGQYIQNIGSNVGITDERALTLDSTHIDFLHSSLDLKAKLRLIENHQLQNPYSFDMKIDISASGQTQDFNPIFNDPDFRYEDGTYKFQARLDGTADSLLSIPRLLKSEFTFEDLLIRHISDDALLPMDKLQIGLEGSNARLDSLIIPIEDEKLYISGSFDHFLDLMKIPCGGKLRTSLNIYSDTITVDKLVQFFRLDEQPDYVTIDQSPHAIRSVMASTLKKYKPSIQFMFDEVYHDNLNVSDIKAFGQWIDSTSTISLEDVAIHYQQPDGYILTDFSFTLDKPDTTQFTFGLESKAFDFEQFIENAHLIGIENIEIPGQINGLADFQVELTGSFDNYDEIIYPLLKGELVAHIYDGRLIDFKPIIDNMKILKPERFKDIRFAPIDIRTHIDGGRLFLDRTEIQSNAFQIFAEGELLSTDSLEAWVAIPLSNLKKPNLSELPNRTNFYLSGNKIYLALEPDKDGKLGTKIRLSNKKWYKRRGIIEEYRKQRKSGRKEKRAYKKQK